jgi:hypothetical protein
MRSHSVRFAEQGCTIFSSWPIALLLALESSEVIGLRVAKLACGGVDAQREAHFIISEKVDASIEVTASLMSGETVTKVINRLRAQVAANISRLSIVNCITTQVSPSCALSPACLLIRTR